MAPTPTYDKDKLFELVQKNPGASHHEIARALTRHNYDQGRDVTVQVQTVHSALHRYRDEMINLGIQVESRNVESPLVAELKRNTGTPFFSTEQHQGNLVLRRLRQADRILRGLPLSEPEHTKAANWMHERHERREVVDVSGDAVPYLRRAQAWEIDSNGELVSLVTQVKPRLT